MTEPQHEEDRTAPVSDEQVYDWGLVAARTYLRKSGMGSSSEADDITADALEGAWKAQLSYDPDKGGSRFGYTYQLAYYAIVDGLRLRGHYNRGQVSRGEHQNPDLIPEQLRQPVSLDAIQQRMNDEGSGANGQVLEFPDPLANQPHRDFEDRETVAKVLPLLREKDAQVLRRHFLDGETLASIAADRGVTESRICQIKQGALLKLRNALQDEDLDAIAA